MGDAGLQSAAGFRTSPRGARKLRLACDHYLGRLDDRPGRIPAPPPPLLCGAAPRESGRKDLTPDPQPYLPEQAVAPNLVDEPTQPIASAERDDEAGRGG